jgi:hypothetical protein
MNFKSPWEEYSAFCINRKTLKYFLLSGLKRKVKLIGAVLRKARIFAAFRGFPHRHGWIHSPISPIFANSLKKENHLCQ